MPRILRRLGSLALGPVVLAVLASAPAAQVPPGPAGGDGQPRAAAVKLPDRPNERTEKLLLQASALFLRGWSKGDYDFTAVDLAKGKGRSDKDYPSVVLGLQPEGVLRSIRYNHRRELEWICSHLAAANSADAAEALLRIAAVGLDGKRRDLTAGTETVRAIGTRFLSLLASPSARGYVTEVATGAERASTEERAAALQAVAAWGGEGAVAVYGEAFEDRDDTIRLAAVEAIARVGKDGASAMVPLGDLIKEEKEAPVLLKAIEAATLVLRGAGEAIDQTGLRRVATAVIDRLGDVDWRCDLAAVQFLELARMKESVPAMVELLARYAEDEKAVKSGRLTGTLKWETNRVLRSLTGARFPVDQPLAWRSWWQQVGGRFELVEKKEEGAEVKTRASTFFGIPVRGSRVLFILDNSGSMGFPTRARGEDGRTLTGLELAQRELLAAVSLLDEADEFNVVRFSNGPEPWQKRLVPANERNRERFQKFVEGLRADGGTNLWSGLQTGLELRSMAHGDRFSTDVDEVFILSDGAPSAGDIIDPRQIANVLDEVNSFSKLIINTIYIDTIPPNRGGGRGGQSPFDMDGAQLMKTIAEENGGVFKRVSG